MNYTDTRPSEPGWYPTLGPNGKEYTLRVAHVPFPQREGTPRRPDPLAADVGDLGGWMEVETLIGWKWGERLEPTRAVPTEPGRYEIRDRDGTDRMVDLVFDSDLSYAADDREMPDHRGLAVRFLDGPDGLTPVDTIARDGWQWTGPLQLPDK